MKHTSILVAMTSVTKSILTTVLCNLGGCDITVDTDGALKVSNSRLSVTFLSTGTVVFDSTKFDRAYHKGFYDSDDSEQVDNLIAWVKTVMEA